MVEVNAPMAGTIYLQPSPNEPVFVPVGGQVQKSETIALIEVMKSLTPIRAGLNGTVERWLVDDAAAVDAGDTICWIGR
jgi:acetyl-CoA carboxylase biotin carboxyl carrier protein